MKAKWPIRDFCWQPNDFSVLTSHGTRVRFTTSKKIEIQDTPNGIVFQAGSPHIGKLDVHSIGVEKENSMCPSGPMLEVDRVIPIQIGTNRDTGSITRP